MSVEGSNQIDVYLHLRGNYFLIKVNIMEVACRLAGLALREMYTFVYVPCPLIFESVRHLWS